MSGGDRARAGRYVEARRGELNLTQQQLAERARVDTKTIYNLESGTRWPQPKTRDRIERALGLYSGDLQRIAEGGEPVDYEPPPTGRELLSDSMRSRRFELDLDWSHIARDAGMSPERLEEIRRGDQPDADERVGLERAFRWEPGTVDAILFQGGRPNTIENWRRERRVEPYDRLRNYLDGRFAELGLDREKVAAATRIAIEKLQAIRIGEARPNKPEAEALERVARWRPGSVYLILDGGEPVPADRQATAEDFGRSFDEALVRDSDRELDELIEEAKARRARGDTALYDTLMAVKRMNEAARQLSQSDSDLDGPSQQAG
jgi:transcriptional regulator with XRE-family HTH domain